MENFTCSNCGYSLFEKSTVCSNCNFNNSVSVDSQTSNLATNPESLRKTVIPKKEENQSNATLAFKLIPTLNEKDYLRLRGSSVTLSRDQIDPQDLTISSKEHVRFINENGEWYIENLGSNKAVYIQVQDKVKINQGTLIALGNSKIFRFEPD
jgi:uncharacterized Zn finger protein (UPF0148 family)